MELILPSAGCAARPGPRILTNIVDCEPDSVRIGQQVQAVFHDTGQGTALVRFRPAG